MFKGNITTATAVTADTNIPFVVIWNTNGNTRYNTQNNSIEITNPGYYNVSVLLNVTGSANATIGAQLFADDVAIAETLAETTITATTGLANIEIVDTIRVRPNETFSFADLSVQLDGAATITNAVITVEKVR